jgi:hypothetical protein
MAEIRQVVDMKLDPAQAAALAVLVDLEARWENLRHTRPRPQEAGAATQDLHDKQKAYEAFRAKLVAYNKRYRPPHVPELLLNTPARLGIWCRRMRDLHVQVGEQPGAHCPAHLLEKAYRCADRVAARLGKPPVSRPAPPGDIPAAVRDLEALSRWCDELAGAASPGADRGLPSGVAPPIPA